MAGLVPAIHVFFFGFLETSAKTWMPGTSSAKTRFALLAGHDDLRVNEYDLLHKTKRAVLDLDQER